MSEGNVLGLFHPIVREWFETEIGQPSAAQTEGWPAIERGENTLIIAPTGAGKTLAAFMGCINRLFTAGLEDRPTEGVQVLYISPLKALNNDIFRNLETPLAGLKRLCEAKGVAFPEITKAVRTGDTPTRERQRMVKHPPQILITTPESLYLLLTSPSAQAILKQVRQVIVDEIHTLVGTKRGVHLALSLERLQHVTGAPFARVGLSATISPVEETARYLGGMEHAPAGVSPRPVTIVQPEMLKQVDLKVEMPVPDFRTLEEGSIWPSIYRDILGLVQDHKSTIVFVNNRSVAEKVSSALNDLAGTTVARAHHGSLSRDVRQKVEQQLKDGELPCLVATSSMELGIDVGAIDLMIQVASPKSVSRGLQRLGRAGHKLGATSKGRIIPRTRADLLESAIIGHEMLEKHLEQEKVPRNSLDVLAQQLVAMSAVENWRFDDAYALVRRSYPFSTLRSEEMEAVLEMLAAEFEHQEDSPRRPRLTWDSVNRVISAAPFSRLLAMSSGGTIPDRGDYPVVLDDGTRVGELDEQFVFEARRGDRFMLGTSAWKIDRIENDRVLVSPCSVVGATSPFWTGDGLGRPYALARNFGGWLRELEEHAGKPGFVNWVCGWAPIDETAALNLERYIMDQKTDLGYVPTDRRIVVEFFSDEVGDRRAVIHSVFGGRVNSGLAILLERALANALHCQVDVSSNDDGVLVHFFGIESFPGNIMALVKSSFAEQRLVSSLPTTPLYSMTFRYNAARALMLGAKKMGKRSPLWIQRMRALETLQIAEKTVNHPLIVETFRECMETLLDVPSLLKVLREVEAGSIEVVERVTSHPSPFTAELLFNFLGVMMYEGQIPNPKKPQKRVVSGVEALHLDYDRPPISARLDPAVLKETAEKNGPFIRLVDSAEELHTWLLTFGDLPEGGPIADRMLGVCTGNLNAWLHALAAGRRAVRIVPQGGAGALWVAAEEQKVYDSAFGSGGDKAAQDTARLRVLRRFVRYYGPVRAEDIEKRYGIGTVTINGIMAGLTADGQVVRGNFAANGGEEWCHVRVIERARWRSLARLASEAKEPAALATFLPAWQGIGAPVTDPVEALYTSIQQLKGVYLPPAWWEDFIFPARIPGYQKGYLDRLCATGRVTWRVDPGEGSPRLAWYLPEDIAAEYSDTEAELTASERNVYDQLRSCGAVFLSALSGMTGLDTQELLVALQGLVWKGLVVNDSFEPVRFFALPQAPTAKAAASRRAAAYRLELGRWEAARPVRVRSLDEDLEDALRRGGIIARETWQRENTAYPWPDAYNQLVNWEYSGKVQRGYYVKGMSGRQFMLPEATAMWKQHPSAGYSVLDACDPAQAYGSIVAHYEGHEFTCVPGTAIVLKDGHPVLLAERNGQHIQPLAEDQDVAVGALVALLDAFHSRRLWAGRRKLVLKRWGDEAPAFSPWADALSRAGFAREMQDMVVWRKV
jgi:ATP-dependent Lhr-like helicase